MNTLKDKSTHETFMNTYSLYLFIQVLFKTDKAKALAKVGKVKALTKVSNEEATTFLVRQKPFSSQYKLNCNNYIITINYVTLVL